MQTAKKDRYGPWIAEVYLLNGCSVNQMLVAGGHAWWYYSYAPNDKVLDLLQTEARRAKKGLWSQKEPIPPWRFRQKHYQTGKEN